MKKRSKKRSHTKSTKKRAKRRAAHKRPSVVLINPSNPTKRRRKRRNSSSKKRPHAKRRRRATTIIVRKNPSRRRSRRRRNPEMGTGGQIAVEVGAAVAGTAVSWGADQLNVSPTVQMAIAEGVIVAGATAAHFAELPGARAALIGVGVKDAFDRGRFLMIQADATKPKTDAKKSGTGAIRVNEGAFSARQLGVGAVRVNAMPRQSVGGGL